MKITFALLAESHFPLLLKWLEAPHVKKWWDQDVTYTMDLVREKYSSYIKGYKLINGAQKPIQGFIIHNNQNPVGYIQIYNAYDFPRSKSLLDLPENLGAFDIFIGEAAALQQGLGSKAILEFLKLHGNPYTHIFADPDSNNVAAVKCYERAGFKKLSEQKDTKEVWMLLKNKVVSVNNVEHFVWGNLCDGWWLKKGGNFTVIEEMMPPSGLEVKHFHNLTEQFFYVLNGTLYIEIDDHEYKLDNNQGIEIPVGAVHQVLNKFKDSVRFLVISCPDSHSDRINVEDSKPASNLDNEPIFSDISDPIFDNKIDKALRHECEKLTDINTNFERINVYLKHEQANVAATICYIHGEILWCDSIYVEEVFQKKGFGRQLIGKLLEIALTRNLREIQLNTYFPEALAFFKKCGFEELAVVPRWKYDLTCYLMRKII